MSAVRLLALLAFAVLGGCAASHWVRPLGRGKAVVTTSLGGPIFGVDTLRAPVPNLVVGGAYGVSDSLEVFGQWNLTGLVDGIAHLESGMAFHPLIRERGWVPTLTVAVSTHLIADLHDVRVFPQTGFAAAWSPGRRHLIYLGIDLGWGLGEVFRILPVPFVGAELRLGRRIGLALETKWLGPQLKTDVTFPDWLGPGSHGALSVLLGVNVYLGREP